MPTLRPAGITGVGAWAPPNVLTNLDLEKIVDTTDEWIRTRSGISERRRAGDDMATSDIASKGALKALENAKVDPSEIDLIINTLVSPDMIMPSTACIIQENIGAKNAGAFDLFAGCTGFVYGLTMGTKLVSAGAFNKVLVVGCDLLTKLLDWEDRNTCVLFGDGGGAAVVEPVEEGFGVMAHTLKADGAGAQFIELPGGGTRNPATHETVDNRMHYIKMLGRDVFKFAVRVCASTIKKLAAELNQELGDIDIIVPHQANDRIIDAAAKRLKMPKDKFYSNLEKYGNTSAGSIPLALNDALKEKRIKKGDIVYLVGFGSGLTWGGIALKWAYDPK